MYKIKVTEKSGASIEYISDLSIIDRLPEMGHGKPERNELDENGEPTGNIIPADYTVEVQDFTYEYNLLKCIEHRVAEYPTPLEFMNAFFDGNEEAIKELQEKRLAIKAKYPKPTKE